MSARPPCNTPTRTSRPNPLAGTLRRLTTHVSHVLPVSDDGGSTAEIVRVIGGPAVGDIRSRCLRLADDRDEEVRGVWAGVSGCKINLKIKFEDQITFPCVLGRARVLRQLFHACFLCWCGVSCCGGSVFWLAGTSQQVACERPHSPTPLPTYSLPVCSLTGSAGPSATLIMSDDCPHHTPVLPHRHVQCGGCWRTGCPAAAVKKQRWSGEVHLTHILTHVFVASPHQLAFWTIC